MVVLTAQDSREASRGFLGALPALTARTRVLVGTVAGEADAPVERPDASDVYREAAAGRAAREAARVAAAMTRAGAEAISDTPDALPPRIADRYIALKAAGRL